MAPVILGCLLRSWAAGYLFKGKRVAVGGPYALIRNPLYVGSFVLGKKSFGKLDISGGLRFDNRSVVGDALYLNALGEKTTATGSPAGRAWLRLIQVVCHVRLCLCASVRCRDDLF